MFSAIAIRNFIENIRFRIGGNSGNIAKGDRSTFSQSIVHDTKEKEKEKDNG